MRITRLALTHSGAVTGDTARVVGYGAWMAHDAEVARLSPAHREEAVRIAGSALHARARTGRAPEFDLGHVPVPLRTVAATFVTLTRRGRLRGCIGSLSAHRPFADDVAANAVQAGFADPRFPPVTLDELAGMEVEIAVLSRPAPMRFADEDDLLAQLRPGRDGLILESGHRRGTFLPKVWEQLPRPCDFVCQLKAKAGLAQDDWPADMQVWRYVAESFKGPVSAA